MEKIIDQQIVWDEKTNHCALVTKYADGSLKSEVISPAESAQWKAEHGY